MLDTSIAVGFGSKGKKAIKKKVVKLVLNQRFKYKEKRKIEKLQLVQAICGFETRSRWIAADWIAATGRLLEVLSTKGGLPERWEVLWIANGDTF